MSVGLFTWNIMGVKGYFQLDEGKRVKTLFGPDVPSTDIVAVCLIEIVEDASEWCAEIQNKALGPTYELLSCHNLAEMMVAIFIRKELLPHVTDVERETRSVARLGATLLKQGPRGAVAIRFEIPTTTFCFVGVQLTSGVNHETERNQEFDEIVHKVIVGNRSVLDHDHVIVFGSLNYRLALSAKLRNQSARELCPDNDWRTILATDALRQQMASCRALEGFREHAITFNPTYKYEKNSEHYDSSSKPSPPGWTDRIIFRCRLPHTAESQRYWSPTVAFTHHQPVLGILKLSLLTINPTKLQEVRSAIVSSMGAIAPCVVVPLPTADAVRAFHTLPTDDVEVKEFFATGVLFAKDAKVCLCFFFF